MLGMVDLQQKHTLPPGYELRGYQLLNVLGVGGFGVTYLAKHAALGRKVAIKEYLPNEIAIRHEYEVFPKSEADRQDFEWGLARFLDEARTLARFQHRNLVQVRDYFESNRTAFIVMDYEDGESLDRLLANHGVLTETQLLRVLLPIADGLQEIHTADYLHRDIKPSNVYVRRSDESPVLLDFGAARQALGRKSRSLTAVASKGYSPPEQYESEGNHGPWTDIYALSALCYQAITGNAPIEAPRRLSRLARGQPDPLPRLADTKIKGFSRPLLEAVDNGLQVIESDRPVSLDQWLSFLSNPSTATVGQESIPSVPPESDQEAIAETRQSFGHGIRQRLGRTAWNAVKSLTQPAENGSGQEPRLWLALMMVESAVLITKPYLLAGVLFSAWWTSVIIRGIFLRRIEQPRKQFVAILIMVALAGALTALVAADGGQRRDIDLSMAFLTAGLVLMAFQIWSSLTWMRSLGSKKNRLKLWLVRNSLIVAIFVGGAVDFSWNIAYYVITPEAELRQLPAARETWDETAQPSSASNSRASPRERTEQYSQELREQRNRRNLTQPFTIDVVPTNARVRILNIQPTYVPGMMLRAGDYHVEVSAAGFETVVETIRHETAQPTVHRVELQLPVMPARGNVAGRLEPGDFRLETGAYADFWTLQGSAGQTLVADLESRDFDAVLYLADSQINQLGRDDDSGGETNARLTLNLEESGEYVLVATSYSDGEVGSYQLNVEFPTALEEPDKTQRPEHAIQAMTFTRGSHEDDVLRLQGTPTSINRFGSYEKWYFELSSVDISARTRQVTEWSNIGRNLKVQLLPGPNITASSSFTRGSHEDDVLRLQGTPTSINRFGSYEKWYFELSSVDISATTRQVTAWSNISRNLKVR